MENLNDWDLQAVVRSCSFAHAEQPGGTGGARHDAAAPAPAPPNVAVEERRAPARAAPVVTARASAAVVKGEASPLYGLEYLDLDHKPFLLPLSTTMAGAASLGAARDDGREVMISFPAASTSGVQLRAAPPGRKARGSTQRPKRSKRGQPKKVVREMPVADGGVSSSDPWAWRKYGQKPIKGSPYPRGYYKCSSMKGCMARKLVERSPAKPGVLIVTYIAEHCHPVPTQLNALAGTTRHTKSSAAASEDHHAASSSKNHEQQGPTDDEAARCDAADSNDASTVAVECGSGAEEAAAALADDESEFWPAGMDMDEFLATTMDDDGVLGRQLSF